MLKLTLWFIISACTFKLSASFPGKILGPGTFIFQSFENCDPPVTELDLWLTQKKYNRTTSVIDMTLSTPWPLSDDVIVLTERFTQRDPCGVETQIKDTADRSDDMEIKTATKKDGGYKPGSFYLKGPFCKTLKTLVGDLFNAILTASGVDDCPIPGAIVVNDFYVDSDKLNDQILYGEYRAELSFFVDEKLKGCYLMYLNLVPKE